MISNNEIKNNFWTPIVFDNSIIQKRNCLSRFFIQLGSLSDRYVYLGKAKINASTLKKEKIKYPVLKTAIKIVSFVLTVFMLPLIALGIKAGYQYWAKKNLTLPTESPKPQPVLPKTKESQKTETTKKQEEIIQEQQNAKLQLKDTPPEPITDRVRTRMIKNLLNKTVKPEEKEQHREMLLEFAKEHPGNTSMGKLIHQALTKLDQQSIQSVDDKRKLSSTYSVTDLRKLAGSLEIPVTNESLDQHNIVHEALEHLRVLNTDITPEEKLEHLCALKELNKANVNLDMNVEINEFLHQANPANQLPHLNELNNKVQTGQFVMKEPQRPSIPGLGYFLERTIDTLLLENMHGLNRTLRNAKISLEQKQELTNRFTALKDQKRKGLGARPILFRSESGHPYMLKEVDGDDVHNVTKNEFLKGKTPKKETATNDEPVANKQEDTPSTSDEAYGTMCVKSTTTKVDTLSSTSSNDDNAYGTICVK